MDSADEIEEDCMSPQRCLSPRNDKSINAESIQRNSLCSPDSYRSDFFEDSQMFDDKDDIHEEAEISEICEATAILESLDI